MALTGPGKKAMSPAIPTLARRTRHHRRRTPVAQPPPRGDVRRIVLRFEWLEDRTVLSTFTVTNIADSGPGSLRQAILDANAATRGTNAIDFQIPGQGVPVIAPASPLPAITRAVLIDGRSQPGFVGTPLIALDGSQAGTADGLTIIGPGVAVRGLDIGDFSGAGIHITGTDAIRVWIYGDFLGTDPTGTQAQPNDTGVVIDAGASDNLVGTDGDGRDDAAERNLISGNNSTGLWISGFDANGNSIATVGNVVAGDLIGTDVTGKLPLGNGSADIQVDSSATSNWIGVNPRGGTAYADEGNVIAGNADSYGVGIDLYGNGNVIAGNEIGTDATGTLAIPNGIGIVINSDWDSGSGNTIGGATAVEGNLITHNAGLGVEVDGGVGNRITGNRIYGNDLPAIDLNGDGVTYNAPSPRQGPDDLQNFPIVVRTAEGRLEGWLGGSLPDTSFHLEFYANSGYKSVGPWTTDQSGEAEDFLGSLDVTTDDQGQAIFDVPFSPPPDLPLVTATATDPQGNTSEVSAARRSALASPGSLRFTPGHPLVLSAATGNGISVEDLDAGPLDPTWALTLSVTAGTLYLPSTVGLVGAGNGTGSLTYAGLLSDLNAALDGLSYSPPPGLHGNVVLSVDATSDGALLVDTPVLLSDGRFLVTTTADDGPGSLRQAILDSDEATGGTNSIDFAISGPGVHTIEPASPLPTITNPVLIDGFSQPGYAGSPLIELSGSQAGDSSGLVLNCPDITVRGLDINGFSGAGIAIDGNTYSSIPISDDLISSNFIGTDPTGEVGLPNGTGVSIFNGASDNLVGGNALADGNLIAFNSGPGVEVDALYDGSGGTGNRILSNRIFGNGGLAIDLGGDGITRNATVPRDGPNHLQNYPVLARTADGHLEGWLNAGGPGVLYDIDVFASAAFGSGGGGEAEDYLGSLEVMTDAQGQAIFDIPFTAPDDRPVVTASATDPQGNTSEVSPARQAALDVPGHAARLVREGPFTFSATSGDGVSVSDPDAGPLDPSWTITLSVSSGTLTLPDAPGLDATGNGTGSLTCRGPLALLNTVLTGLTFTPPPGFHGNAILRLAGDSYGATSLETQFIITNGLFSVTTGADSGPGSLRQAILDSDAATGGTNTVAFEIPGAGVHTIALQSPLPTITESVRIDGTLQPGYAGAPLVVLDTSAIPGPDALSITGARATLAGVVAPGVTFGSDLHAQTLVIQSGPIRAVADEEIARYRIDATGEGVLDVQLDSLGLMTRLSLLDARGNVIVSSDGGTNGETDPHIDEHVAPGGYFLELEGDRGVGSYVLTASLTPSTAPYAAIYVSQFPLSIAEGDFNGDGHLDAVVVGGSNGPGGVAMLLGHGDGTFQPPAVYAANLGLISVAVADFNGDGRLDLVAGEDYSTNVVVMLGVGDGTFLPPTAFAAGSGPVALVTGDFNGDQRADLAVAYAGDTYIYGSGPGGGVAILLGNGDGTFQPAVSYAVGTIVLSIVAGDFDGDGTLDLATGNIESHGVSILLNRGDGTFLTPSLALSEDERTIESADFNGDGRLDLALVSTGEVSLGNGDGTFQAPRRYGQASSMSLAAADFNGDGHPDLAAGFNDNGSMFLGDGDGTFQQPIPFQLAGGLFAIIAGDFDGDGRPDLAAVLHFFDSMAVLLGNGDGSFRPQSVNAVGIEPTSVATGDFNGDGRLDLAAENIGDGTISVLLGNGDGTFQRQAVYRAGPGVFSLGVGDFNGDGRLDLATLIHDDPSNTYGVSVLLGNGDGSFRPPTNYDVPGSYFFLGEDPPTLLVTGDFNDDGKLDLATGSCLLLGNGDGTFQEALPHWTAVIEGVLGLAEGDFNGDGHPDLMLRTSGSIYVLLGKGDGGFLAPLPSPAPSDVRLLVVGDFNGDGRLDLATAGADLTTDYQPVLGVLDGNGDGTFQSAGEFTISDPYPPDEYDLAPLALQAGDFNGDGRVDLAVTSSDYVAGQVSIFLGNGDGSFGPQHNSPIGAHAWFLASGDFNGDGLADLAAANSYYDDVPVVLSEGDGSFVDPSELPASFRATPVLADVDGDGAADALVIDSAGDILYRQGVPGKPGAFEPPVTINPGLPSREIAWLPHTNQGPLLAGVDARDNAVTFYWWRDGRFVPLGSLRTGRVPAQAIAADLNDDGLTDLVVRNAEDGTLSIDYGATSGQSGFVGSIDPRLRPPSFAPSLTLPVGIGTSDVQAIDSTGSGRLDLVVTNQLAGEVGIVPNLGDGAFGPLVFYRAGTGSSTIDPSSVPEVTSLEATASVASAPITPGARTTLVAANPGSYTLGVLVGMGSGRFANPVAIETPSPVQIIRLADLAGSGIPDLVLLGSSGVTVMMGDGQGGFGPPVTYDGGPEPTGLTVADITGAGIPDLVVSDAYGDLLILLGNGDGTFASYHKVDQSVALAVADLTGDGKADFVYADRGLDRVSVQYGGDQTKVLGDRSDGILSPGAVKLADMNGDGIPDLVVANSGSNNILVYPGTGDGQFGPALNGGHGFYTGTNPTGFTVADVNGDGLPDLLVANTGSNDVSVLLGQGSRSTWTLTPGPRIKTDAGPAAVIVGNILNDGHPDLAVANSQANDVQIFPGIGGGFFNDQPQAVKTYPVGQAPDGLFLGNFDGSGTSIAALNAGSNSITVIGPAGQEQTVSTGGTEPTTGFAGDFNGNGLTDLVVGNTADGHLALLMGGSGGLVLSQTITDPAVPEPTGLSFAGVSGGVLSFYATTAGREAATELAFDLNPEEPPSGSGAGPGTDSGSGSVSEAGPGPGAGPAYGPVASAGAVLASATAGAFQQVAQLLGANGSTLSLVAPLLTVTVLPGEFEADGASEGGLALLANFLPGTGPGAAGQGLRPGDTGSPEEAADEPAPEGGQASQVAATPPALPVWDRVVMGLQRAWEQVRSEVLERAGLADGDGAGAGPDAAPGRAPAPARPSNPPRPRTPAPPRAGTILPAAPPGEPTSGGSSPGEGDSVGATDAAIEELTADDRPEVASSQDGAAGWVERLEARRVGLAPPIATAAAMASAATVAWAVHAARGRRRAARDPSGSPASAN